ncbi:hypothetical protein NGI46_22580 [Peribacillus butanolivorans]|nr:hypothetical protein [Peribacillus butanolivorans]MCO0600156.1 hypothetical protein [Peribacillus butanolivorans]
MGLSLDEFTNLSEFDKENVISKTANSFMQNGADFTIKTMSELPDIIERINSLISDGKRPRTN